MTRGRWEEGEGGGGERGYVGEGGRGREGKGHARKRRRNEKCISPDLEATKRDHISKRKISPNIIRGENSSCNCICGNGESKRWVEILEMQSRSVHVMGQYITRY